MTWTLSHLSALLNYNHGDGRYGHGKLTLTSLSKGPAENPSSSTCVLHTWKPLFLFLLESSDVVFIQCDYKTEEKIQISKVLMGSLSLLKKGKKEKQVV